MGAGVSAERLAAAEALLAEGVGDGLYTHAAYALARGGRVLGRRAFGVATPDTVFDLASLTKPMATATLCLQLAEQGRLHLRQSAAHFFEAFGPQPHLEGVEIRHLLTHTSGLPPVPRWVSEAPASDRNALVRSALGTPPLRPPGGGYTYSDAGYILLGEIVAQVAGRPLPDLFAAGVAEPLGLTATGFGPPSVRPGRLAPTEHGAAPGLVHDPRARDLGGVAGHAGLFGTADDVLAYAEAIRTGGPPVLSRAAAARMRVSQIAPTVGAQSYGFFCAGNDFLPGGDLLSDRAFGHSGFTGTLLLIDPEYDLSLALLTNRVVNAGEDGSRFLRLRRFWLNMVAAALE
ncbi:MAG: beta-lactamase family protein [Armatimonadetes bacterium]|nr:beta-lactamase family protein [Armatimonadota bacterium]